MEKKEFPVVVVGAGPTGLLLTALLGKEGVPVLLVDKNSTVSTHPKAILIDDEALRSLQVVGLSEELKNKCLMGYGARYYNEDGECFAKIEPSIGEYGYPKRNSFLQPELESLLEEKIKSYSSVTFLRECEFISQKEKEDSVYSVFKKSGVSFEVKSSLLIGSDGGGSAVRRSLGLSLEGFGYEADWVVLDTKNDKDSSHYTKFICDPRRPFVSIPAPGGGRRYEFQMKEGETKEEVLSLEFLRSVLAPHRSDLEQKDLIRAAVYRFSACVASFFSKGRVFLAGDSCHLTPPFAGQGMNTGLRDAHNLAWKVSRVLKGESAFSLLESYEAERLEKVREMVQFAVTLGEVVMPKTPLESKVMTTIWKLANLVPEAKSYISQMKFKPKPHYEKGAFLFPEKKRRESFVGKMIPQPLVSSQGGEASLFDEFLGSSFSLIGVGEGTSSFLKSFSHSSLPSVTKVLISEEEDLIEEEGLRKVSLLKKTETEDFPTVLQRVNKIYLVRPDRYVFLEGSPEEFEGQIESIKHLL